MKDVVIGIDLGTTNSEVAVVVDGSIEILTDADGRKTIPSCVGIAPDGTLLIGQPAAAQCAAYPERTVRSIKRKMGADVQITLADKTFTPTEISALILGHLKRLAEQRLGQPVHKAVITVPAFFSEGQRQATREAGELAGLDVLRILNEPTAAALAYDQTPTDGTRTVLVYDLGGGTFDVSLVQAADDLVEVRASHGDNHLGGDDFDELILQLLRDELALRAELDATSTGRLRDTAEAAKISLSEDVSVRVAEDHLAAADGETAHLDCAVERDSFDKLAGPLVDRTLNSLARVTAMAKIGYGDIDDVLLVGGATRMPIIAERLTATTGKQPRTDLHPDLAVAYGAGVMAARLMGSDDHRILVDVTPHTFGIRTLGIDVPDHFLPIIPAGTPLPAIRSTTVFTNFEGQEEADADVYQGEAPRCSDNLMVGRFRVTGFSDDLPENSPVVVRMELGLDGILKCTAVEKPTGKRCEVVIERAVRTIDRSELADAMARLNELHGDDDAAEAATAATEESAVGQRLRRALPSLSGVDKSDAEALLARLADVSDPKEIAAIETEIDDLLFYAEVD